MEILLEGVAFGESPRWHDGRLYFSDWGKGQVIALGRGEPEVIAAVASFPLCFDFLPDGRPLLVDSAGRRLSRREPDGTLVTYADLSEYSEFPWNDIVIDGAGTAFVNNIGYDFPAGPPGPGLVAAISPEGRVRVVAEGLSFPNGMAVTEDGRRLIVAESHAQRLTAFEITADGGLGAGSVWADTPGDHPDGICLDTTGALWYADVGNRRCVRIREGGEILDIVDLDRGAFACVLDRAREPRLYVVAQNWGGAESDGPTGRVLACPAPAPGAGRP